MQVYYIKSVFFSWELNLFVISYLKWKLSMFLSFNNKLLTEENRNEIFCV